jgi:hypothetical protein
VSEVSVVDKESNEPEFMTKPKFRKLVDGTVRRLNMTYMDAVIHVCEENGIELEDVKRYVNVVLKGKLEAEAMSLNFLEKNAQLPSE